MIQPRFYHKNGSEIHPDFKTSASITAWINSYKPTKGLYVRRRYVYAKTAYRFVGTYPYKGKRRKHHR